MEERPLVFVLDDDSSVRKGLDRLLSAHGFRVRLFGSAEEFRVSDTGERPACLVLDVRLPGVDGLALQDELTRHTAALPIVFITGHGDIPMSVKAMKKGAVDFLAKPFSEAALLGAIEEAMKASRLECERQIEMKRQCDRLSCLSTREREIMLHVVAGKLNKQTAAELGISEKTVKIHRGRVMHKLSARSVAELIGIVNQAGIPVIPRGA